ncbi:MAG: recombinase [Flavobacteriia bacterium]|nr:recombinase [Flavobacteriia bacterium]
MRGKPTVTKLKKKLDAIFSKYIRLKYADKDGFVECFTCGVKKFWEKDGMQAGHFMSRKHTSTRFDEQNVKPQCYSCNCHFYGRQFIFGQNLNKKYGEGTAEKLLQKSRQTLKNSVSDLQDLIELYTNKFDQLDKK